jgi:hypothetical protein
VEAVEELQELVVELVVIELLIQEDVKQLFLFIQGQVFQ